MKPKTEAVRAHRRRAKRQGLCRVEVSVPRRDAELVRRIGKALQADGDATLRARLMAALASPGGGLKELLQSAPRGDLVIERSKQPAREVDV